MNKSELTIIVSVSGVVLFGIDTASGMPASWTFSEGPPMLAIGLILMLCGRRIQSPAERTVST